MIYLQLYNALLPLEQRLMQSEMELVTEFALLPDDKFQYQRFGTLAKNKVIEASSRSLTKMNINNKLYSLLDKNFLKRDEDKVIYLPKHFTQALQAYRKDPNFAINITFPRGNS